MSVLIRLRKKGDPYDWPNNILGNNKSASVIDKKKGEKSYSSLLSHSRAKRDDVIMDE